MDNNDINKFVNSFAKELSSYTQDNWDLYVSNSRSRSISYREKSVENFKESVESGYCLRILKDNKISLVYGNSFDVSRISSDVEKAHGLLQYIASNEHNEMRKELEHFDSLSEVDMAITDVHVSEKIEQLSRLESLIYSQDKRVKNIEHLGFSESLEEVYYRTAFSDIAYDKGAFYGFDTDLIADDGSGAETGSSFDYGLKFGELDIDKIAKEAVFDAVNMLGAKPIKSGEYMVLFRNDVMASFLSAYAPLFSAEEVNNKRSVLEGKLGKIIAKSNFSLVDDATLVGGLNKILFDGEGTRAQKTNLVVDGVLAAYLYDIKNANKDNVASTGNALRYSYQGSPVVRPTNMTLQPGNKSYDKLVGEASKIVVINNVMGMHTANRVNGDFSVGATGFVYENGKLTESVRQFTIAGNYLDMLQRIIHVGNDVESFPFGGNIVTPSVLFDSIAISGI